MLGKNKITNPFRDLSDKAFAKVIKELEGIDGEGYYSLLRILEKGCDYSMVFGERTNGKTTNALAFAILVNIMSGYKIQTALFRRWDEDFKGKNAKQVMEGIIQLGWIEKWTGGKYNSIYYYGMRWYFCKYNAEGKRESMEEKPCIQGFSLNSEEHYKSSTYPEVHIIIFDEFISRQYYLPDEFITFQNLCSTIIRLKDDMRIIMLGNTINMFCPYFKEMGLTNIKKMKKTDIDVYQYGDTALTVAVEYSDFKAKEKTSNKYFAFDNPKLKMIKEGGWEIALYPHLPHKYDRSEVIYEYFVVFEDVVMHCEVISLASSDMVFTYVHRKTSALKEDNSLIYRQGNDPRPNIRRNILKGTLPIERKIASFYTNGQVYYQDNQLGETMRNYLMWCAKDIPIK